MAFSSISFLWNKWNIPGFVMLSLLLQIFLILFAPLRKKITNNIIIFLFSLAYLMADWVAAFAIGLISHNQGNSSHRGVEPNGVVHAFWASFLLLHLGGPDTIAAFTREDSSLWQRHMLRFIFQVGAAIYVFVQIFPGDKMLVIPTMLVFFVGITKNVERTLALNLSSLPKLRKSMMVPYMPRTIHHGEFKELLAELNTQGEGQSDEAKLAESTVVKHAYYFFNIFKVFIGDLMFYSFEGENSCKYFQKVSAIDALRVISVELDFMYEVLYTKMLAIRSKWSYIFRFVAFVDLVLAFILFNRFKKHCLLELDVKITYSLLFGGMALDAIALFMLVFSDWTLAKIMWHQTIGSSKPNSCLHKLVAATDYLRKPRSNSCEVELGPNAKFAVLDTPFIFRRWSESISACNLFSESLNESPRKIYKHSPNICCFLLRTAKKKIVSCFYQVSEKFCGPREIVMIENTNYVSKNPFINKLWIFIFTEVKRKSINATNEQEVQNLFEARGDLFLRSPPTEENCGDFLAYVTRTSYDTSIICWHLATEIWYNKENSTERNEEREFSKILSDYMLYLLLNQNNVVFAIAGVAQITLAAAVSNARYLAHLKNMDLDGLCMELYAIDPELYDWASALIEGSELARKMGRLGEGKWKVMSGVWVEVLCYAAGHIKGESHVQVLSKGGELLAFVWLLMAHLGCFYKPGWGTSRILEPDHASRLRHLMH